MQTATIAGLTARRGVTAAALALVMAGGAVAEHHEGKWRYRLGDQGHAEATAEYQPEREEDGAPKSALVRVSVTCYLEVRALGLTAAVLLDWVRGTQWRTPDGWEAPTVGKRYFGWGYLQVDGGDATPVMYEGLEYRDERGFWINGRRTETRWGMFVTLKVSGDDVPSEMEEDAIRAVRTWRHRAGLAVTKAERAIRLHLPEGEGLRWIQIPVDAKGRRALRAVEDDCRAETTE